MMTGTKLIAAFAALLALAACGDDGDNDRADDTPFGSTFEQAFDQDPNDEPIEIEGDAGLTVDPTADPIDI